MTDVLKSANRKYRQRADKKERLGAAAMRGNGDPLQLWLAQQTLDENGRLDVSRLDAICAANKVAISTDRTRHGWQGRLRAAAGNRLRSIIRRSGNLRTPEGVIVSLSL
jgi:hypothetical protein